MPNYYNQPSPSTPTPSENTDPTYSITPSAATINEGESLITSISTTNVAVNTTRYYSLSGTGINSDDFLSGSLTGSGTIDSDGNFSFSHTLANDLVTEGNETVEIRLFSDSSLSNQVGKTSSLVILDTSKNANLETKIVTVETKSSSHPYFGQGSSKGYLIDGQESPSLTLRQNVVYRFDQSDSSNRNHRILFFTDVNKINSYRTNVTEVGTAGSTGAYTEITFTGDTSVEIFYQCQNHPLMGSDLKTSSSGDDTLISSSSNELFDGGEGIDTVHFTGNFTNYSFTRGTDSLQITDQRSGINDGTDTLQNVEYIQFADQTIEESKVDVIKSYSGEFSDYTFYSRGNGVYEIKTDSGYDDITGYPLLRFSGEESTSALRDVSAILDIKGTFDQVTGLNTDSGRIFRLYNAAFKRLPDAGGLEYWIDQFSSGANSIRVIAESFVQSPEFAERYGSNLTDEQFVNTVYQNVLGREADIGGLNYWLDSLSSGAETRSVVLLGFIENPENLALFTEMTGFG